MTDSEQKLWNRIRSKQINHVQFYRQKPIGRYIVDFYAPAAKLVIEIDGSQHYEENVRVVDAERDAYMRELGIQVLRFNNRQVLTEINGVLEVIENAILEGKSPLAPPLSKWGINLNV